MTREPEWDRRSRLKAMALLSWEASRCPSCGNYDSLVPADPPETGPARVTWPGGRAVTVRQFRCLTCGAVELMQRDWESAHENDPKPAVGRASERDGRVFVAQPAIEED